MEVEDIVALNVIKSSVKSMFTLNSIKRCYYKIRDVKWKIIETVNMYYNSVTSQIPQRDYESRISSGVGNISYCKWKYSIFEIEACNKTKDKVIPMVKQ